MSKRVIFASLTMGAMLAWQSTALAGDPAVAREQLKIGYGLAQEGKCEDALPHFVESLRLDPKAITLINLADCEEKVGKLADALAHWADARARASAEGARPIEEEATKRAAALDPRLPRLTITLAATAPKDATVERDGIALGAPSLNIPLPVDPGAHALVVKAKGHAEKTMSLTIAEGESKRVELDVGPLTTTDVPPAKPPANGAPDPREPGEKSSLSPLVYIGFGTAAVGVAVGTATGIIALGKGNDAEKACPNQQCTSQEALDKTKDNVDSGRTVGWISTISFGVAAVGAGVGIYGLLFAREKSPSTNVGLSFAPNGAVLRGRF